MYVYYLDSKNDKIYDLKLCNTHKIFSDETDDGYGNVVAQLCADESAGKVKDYKLKVEKCNVDSQN